MSGILVDFEVLPGDGPGDKTPNQVHEDISRQLQDQYSALRTGDFGYYASRASLHASGESPEFPSSAPELAPSLHDLSSPHHPEPSSHAVQQQSNQELMSRIASLEGQLHQRAGMPEPHHYSHPTGLDRETLDEKCTQLERRLEAKEREVMDTQEAHRADRAQLQKIELLLRDREQLLAHAKEMWMKESSRASKLAEALSVAENKIADQERRLAEVSDRYGELSNEAQQLKVMFERHDGFVRDNGFDQRNDRVYNHVNGKGVASPATSPALYVSPTLEPGPPEEETNADRYRHLCLVDDAVLFEDDILQVGVKGEHRGSDAQLSLFFGNKSNASLQSFHVQYFVREEYALRLDVSQLAPQLDARDQVMQRVSVTCLEPFVDPPAMRISFLLPDTSPRRIQLRLPVLLTKFMEGWEVSSQEFFRLWRDQVFVVNEVTGVVNLAQRFQGSLVHIARCICFGKALKLHHGFDSNPENFVLVGRMKARRPESDGVALSSESGLALVRVEIGAGRFAGKARIVVRSQMHSVAKALVNSITVQISAQLTNEAC